MLLAAAAAAVALGPRGQRPVNALVLGGSAFAAAFFGLGALGHPWLGGSVAVIAGTLALLFGAVTETWGTALLMAVVLGVAAGAPVAMLKHAWAPVAAVAGSIGLFVGVTRHRKLEVVLPPIFAAIFLALGLAIGWAPHRRGAVLPQLLEPLWVIGLALLLMAPLLAIAIYRERARKARLQARTQQMDDEDLKKALAERQAEHEAAAQAAMSAADAPPDPESDAGSGA